MNIVVKLGGHALDSLALDAPVLVDLARDVVALRERGDRVVVVHGGGPQIADLLGQVGLESRFHEGLRVTDERTMTYVAMALGQVNRAVVTALGHAGLRAVGLSGADATTITARSLGDPWDRAGGDPRVEPQVLIDLLNGGCTPVLSPVSVDENGGLLNCNADTVAGAVAGALNARLVLLSDIDQLRADPDNPDSALAHVHREDIHAMLASGAARDGMRPKVIAALDALDGGALTIHLANGTRPHALRDVLAGTIPTTEITP